VSSARGTLLSVVLVALACALGWPTAAFAAEVMPGVSVPAMSVGEPVSCATEEVAALPPEPMCEIVAIDPDADGFFAAAPICDPSGASALAPEPVHPIGNDRLEATPSCEDARGGVALDASERHDDPGPRTPIAVDPALLPDLAPVPRWWGAITDAGPGRLLRYAEGHRRRLEHPPHGA
jgi:hypothetical protein